MKNLLIKSLFVSLLTIGAIETATADTLVGVIKGASCHLHSTNCAMSNKDPLLVLENDFVIVAGNEYYFMPNLPRAEKISLFNSTVKIDGKISSHQVDVSNVFIQKGNKYINVWDQKMIDYEDYES